VKGIWSIIFSIPVIVLVCFIKNPQKLVTYTGGICGTLILFIFPVALVNFSRKYDKNSTEKNFNASPFQSIFYSILIGTFSVITLYFVLMGIIKGNAGHWLSNQLKYC